MCSDGPLDITNAAQAIVTCAASRINGLNVTLYGPPLTGTAACQPARRSLSPRRAFICARVTLPTFTELGVPEPFSMPAAFCSSTDAGGVFRMKVKLRSCAALVASGLCSPKQRLRVCRGCRARAHLVDGDLYGDDGAHFVLRGRVIFLAEGHDVHALPRALLAQCLYFGSSSTACLL